MSSPPSVGSQPPGEAIFRRNPALPHLPVPRSKRVTVVGGGLAGVAAALVLAEKGVAVTLHEAAPVLGGRLSAWPDRLADNAGGSPVEMERGFHAFFRQYYNVRSLLRRIDPMLRFLRPVDDYPLFGPDGAVESFAGLPRRPPFNLAALVKRTPTLGWRDLRAMNGDVAGEMLAYDGDETYARFDSISAAEFLDEVGFPPDARRMLFEVFAHSFFNAEARMSAAEMLMMFHFYFLGSSEGILFDVLDAPFSDAVWAPMRRLLDRHAVEVHVSSTVTDLPAVNGTDDGLVLAVTVRPLQSLLRANPWLAEGGGEAWADGVARLRNAPPFAVLRIWLDRAVAPERAAFAGTAGLGIIDNISVVDRYQGEAHSWALRNGGSVVELHGYALPDGYDEARVRRELLAPLHALYPETRHARILDERLLLRDDCPAFEPGSWASRPGVATPIPGVVLAGDLVRLPFPTALMERAVASGFVAANQLLERWGVTPEPVWTIPPRGVLAGLQSWRRSHTRSAGDGGNQRERSLRRRSS